MYDIDLGIRIKRLLDNSVGKHYRLKEIDKILRIRKHKHRVLIDTLYGLAKDKEIRLVQKKYTSLKKNNRKFLIGKFDARPLARDKNFAFVICEEADVFISSEDILNAYHNDTVKIEIRTGRRDKLYGFVVKVLERYREEIVGTVHKHNGKYFLEPDNSRIHTSIDIANIKKAVPNDKIVLSIKNWGNREKFRLPIGDVKEVLGKAGDPEVEILSVIKHFDLPLDFPENVKNAVNAISDEISNKEIALRKDLRELNTITIDPTSAKDFDDAISLEKTDDGYELYIHIADVAHFVKLDSPIFEEAFARGNSFYFPKRVIPMLPTRLSNNICSLRPFEDKLAMTVYAKFDKDFTIITQDIFQSVIRSDRRFSYEEIDDYFAKIENDISPQISEILDNVLKLSHFLSNKRKKNGYLYFDLPETQYQFDDEGHVIDLIRSSETDSHKMIENCMLIANEYTSKLLSSHRTLYRVHEKPTESKISQLTDLMARCNVKFSMRSSINKAFQTLLEQLPSEEHHRVFDKMILRSMQKAKYSTINKGHFGLAINNYTHFTSPIRRLCDLVIHHQLKDIILNRNRSFDAKQLISIAEQASLREVIANESEREIDFKNKILFMKKHIGEEFEGIIVGMKQDGMLVELDRYPVIGLIDFKMMPKTHFSFIQKQMIILTDSNKKAYHLTDKIKVSIDKVDTDIYLGIVEK